MSSIQNEIVQHTTFHLMANKFGFQTQHSLQKQTHVTPC